jgi:GntR family transcriptional regulator
MAARPMYQAIADDLRAQIEDGQLGPGAQLPTELELRERYEASRNTIRDAIKRLTGLGLVETRPGQGTFVVQKIDPLVTALTGPPDETGPSSSDWSAAYLSEIGERRHNAMVSPPRVEVQLPATEIASRLRLAPGAQAIIRRQDRYIDGIPWSLQASYYPMDLVTSGKAPLLLVAEAMPDGVVKYLREATGVTQAGYRDLITARNPDENEQVFFRIPHDATVFEIFRTGFDRTGTPMRVTVTVYPADRNQLLVNVGDVPEPEYGQP